MPTLIALEQRPASHDMPSDGTQVIAGYRDGSILAGDAHHLWVTRDDPVQYITPDPELVWWANAERARPLELSDHLAALALSRDDLRVIAEALSSPEQQHVRRRLHALQGRLSAQPERS